ncbi:MAG TPA: hypothetical protein VN687_12895 [Blastocatellia bacterium]|nr:hypothetical protein [Blastocatellia bacterium]
MVKTLLVDQDLTEGRRLLDRLAGKEAEVELSLGTHRAAFVGRRDVRVRAAFWWYLAESEEWRLVIATPLVDEVGPLSAYGVIQATLSAISPPLNLDLQNISLISPKDERVKAIKKALKIAPDPFGVRFIRSALNGTYIEDAYVYRLD